MQNNKICWVTTSWFVDVDLPIIPLLLDKYLIHWIIVLYKNGRYKEEEFEELKKLPNLTIEFINVNQRARHPKTIVDYWRLFFSIKRSMADIVYFNMPPSSPYLLLQYCLINKEKTIYAAHDGSIKSIMGRMMPFLYKMGYDYHAKYVHMFSYNQANEFNINYPGKIVTVIPLMPKDYGRPSDKCKVKEKTFLSFGSMHKEKNVGLLIRAAEELYDEGFHDFMVSICGQPVDWDKEYAPLIKHSQLFNLQLRMIGNDEVPDLFTSQQFVVYPYKAMSQSGALKVAYAYYKPVIVSDLPAFQEEVEEGTNGFFFKSESIDSLKNVMRKCLVMTRDDYSELVHNTTSFVEKHYSKGAIKESYIKMFNQIMNK